MSRRRLSLMLLITLAVAGCGARHASADDQSATLEFVGPSRTYAVHSCRPSIGLAMNLHGDQHRGRAGEADELRCRRRCGRLRRGLSRRTRQKLGRRTRGRRTGPSRRRRRRISGRAGGRLRTQYGIEAGHVFATGMSNGGFMANRLACDGADVFAAVAPVSGTLGSNVACNPSRPVAVLEVHGTADPIVPFDGGRMRGRGGESEIVSAPAMVQRWRAADGMLGRARSGRRAPATEPSCTGSPRLPARPAPPWCSTRLTVADIPGQTALKYLPKAVIGPTTRAFSASEAIGQFFVAYAR